jgi:uncharacterized protein (DUF2132 family)
MQDSGPSWETRPRWRAAARQAIVPLMTTPHDHSSNPLHGITLERMLNELVEQVGWERMGRRVRIACFTSDPSIGSSLKFLRRTPWARAKVEAMYVALKQTSTAERPRVD